MNLRVVILILVCAIVVACFSAGLQLIAPSGYIGGTSWIGGR